MNIDMAVTSVEAKGHTPDGATTMIVLGGQTQSSPDARRVLAFSTNVIPDVIAALSAAMREALVQRERATGGDPTTPRSPLAVQVSSAGAASAQPAGSIVVHLALSNGGAFPIELDRSAATALMSALSDHLAS